MTALHEAVQALNEAAYRAAKVAKAEKPAIYRQLLGMALASDELVDSIAPVRAI